MQTPGGPSARTMDVLNGATDFLNESNKLRAPLPEWDWSPDIEWWPGDPLYPAPVRKYLPWGSSYLQIPSRRDMETGELLGGQHVRPMIQAFDDDQDFEIEDYLMDCEECQVSGDPFEETACWNCGKELARLWKPSDFNQWVNLTSIDERWDNVVPFQPIDYSYGDVVEDFDSGHWTAMGHIPDVVGFDLTPWQERFMEAYARVDVENTRRLYFSSPRLHGNTHISWWDELTRPRQPAREGYHWYEHDGVRIELPNEIQMETEPDVPTNVEIRQSRSRPVPPQRTYPTSTNPTQERRRRNA
jgi:hypothetical protein